MDNPAIVYIPPVKNNIIYFVSEPKAGIQAAFQPVTSRLLRERDMGQVTIFFAVRTLMLLLYTAISFMHLENLVLNPRDHLTMLSIEYLTCTHTAHTHL